jgi:hypothetical protein
MQDELLDDPRGLEKKSLLLLYPIILSAVLVVLGFLFQILHWPLSGFIQLTGFTMIISYTILSFMYPIKTWFLNPLRILGGFALFYLLFDHLTMTYGKAFYFTAFVICLLLTAVIQITFLESRKAIRKKTTKLANQETNKI